MAIQPQDRTSVMESTCQACSIPNVAWNALFHRQPRQLCCPARAALASSQALVCTHHLAASTGKGHPVASLPTSQCPAKCPMCLQSCKARHLCLCSGRKVQLMTTNPRQPHHTRAAKPFGLRPGVSGIQVHQTNAPT